MIQFFLVFNGKFQIRLSRYYDNIVDRNAVEGAVMKSVLKQTIRHCSMCRSGDYILVYRKYGSLFFVIGLLENENGKALNFVHYLEIIHFFVKLLNEKFEGNVREIDFLFSIPSVYLVLEEIIQNGYIVETNKKFISENIIY